MLFYLFSRDELGQILGSSGMTTTPTPPGGTSPITTGAPRTARRGKQLKLAAHPEIVSRPVRAGVPGDVRELRAGDRAAFGLG